MVICHDKNFSLKMFAGSFFLMIDSIDISFGCTIKMKGIILKSTALQNLCYFYGTLQLLFLHLHDADVEQELCLKCF